MKQFNLEEYLANPSRKVVTRDGSKVRIICTDFNNYYYPIIAEIQGMSDPVTFTKEGSFFNWNCDSKNDLFFAPEQHEGWINLYRGVLDVTYAGCVCTSEKEAKESIDDTQRYVATVKIEWEE